jgi:hypothetical protein
MSAATGYAVEHDGYRWSITHENWEDQHVIVGWDEDQTRYALTLLENGAVPDGLEWGDLSEWLEEQIAQDYCPICATIKYHGEMQNGRCSSCLS